MRIATFNLDCFGARTHPDPGSEARVPALRATLTALRADILCLQEINAQNDRSRAGSPHTLAALERLIAGTAYARYQWSVSTQRDGQGPLDVHNLITLSRYTIAERRQLWHDLVPPPAYQTVTAEPRPAGPSPCQWDRPALHTTLELEDGRALHVFNLHLRAPLAAFIPGRKASAFEWKSTAGWAEGFFLATLKRAGQALEARLAIDAILDGDPGALIIACGDMNADEIEMPVRILRADVDDTGNDTLAHRMLIPIERIAPKADRYSVIHAGHRHMLDHILVSRALAETCRTVEIHNDALRDEIFEEATEGQPSGSNHAPIVAEFDI